MDAVGIREGLVDALVLDLVGPGPGSPLADEMLSQAPSRWYLTRFLVPLSSKEEQRTEETCGEQVDELADAGATDDAVPHEPASARRAYFPSSLGLSFLLPAETKKLLVTVLWGDYPRIPKAPAGRALFLAAARLWD